MNMLTTNLLFSTRSGAVYGPGLLDTCLLGPRFAGDALHHLYRSPEVPESLAAECYRRGVVIYNA